MKIPNVALTLALAIVESMATPQQALRHIVPRKGDKIKIKGSSDSLSRGLVVNRAKPKRIRSRTYKICGKGKGKGKARDRHLFPCEVYGDPGDDPMEENEPNKNPTKQPFVGPSVAPSLNPLISRAGSGSNKGTSVEYYYEPYKASGSNDFDRDRTEAVNSTANGVEGVDMNIGEDPDDDDNIYKTDDAVPSNDIPSNDP